MSKVVKQTELADTAKLFYRFFYEQLTDFKRHQ
jgi:hypothetical protein